MAQVEAMLVVNLTPGSGELVVDLCDDLLLLLEAQANDVGVVITKSFRIKTDDETITDTEEEIEREEDGFYLDADDAAEDAPVDDLLAEAFRLGSE